MVPGTTTLPTPLRLGCPPQKRHRDSQPALPARLATGPPSADKQGQARDIPGFATFLSISHEDRAQAAPGFLGGICLVAWARGRWYRGGDCEVEAEENPWPGFRGWNAAWTSILTTRALLEDDLVLEQAEQALQRMIDAGFHSPVRRLADIM